MSGTMPTIPAFREWRKEGRKSRALWTRYWVSSQPELHSEILFQREKEKKKKKKERNADNQSILAPEKHAVTHLSWGNVYIYSESLSGIQYMKYLFSFGWFCSIYHPTCLLSSILLPPSPEGLMESYWSCWVKCWKGYRESRGPSYQGAGSSQASNSIKGLSSEERGVYWQGLLPFCSERKMVAHFCLMPKLSR